ncbi:hypothetical protein MGAST_23155 [Mycobacterium gastri 'Wayne']|uniref:Uncharacterized protein n=1 Tax=Mycobacterium gastri TaxID=1777 RepID=A0A1X1VUF2_MYCGS|nr:hypothetical protein MGAST_23155 [Mycobacterium gastri 'Wayne']ORV72638.1 hypothetical protein AWC07_03635 [Mycobacterium gastri]
MYLRVRERLGKTTGDPLSLGYPDVVTQPIARLDAFEDGVPIAASTVMPFVDPAIVVRPGREVVWPQSRRHQFHEGGLLATLRAQYSGDNPIAG